MANGALPLVDQAFAFFETNVVPAIETAAGFIQLLFDNIAAGQGPVTALRNALTVAFGSGVATRVMEIVTGVQQFIGQVTTAAGPLVDFVTRFVEWQDVLTALGIVVASIVLPALGAIVVAAAPVIAVGAALIAGIALVRNAWENDWGGIQGKVQAVIGFVVPLVQNAIQTIRDWWGQNGDQVLAKAQQVWGTIQTTIQNVLGFVWNGVIVPIVTAIRDFWAAHGDEIVARAQVTWELIKTAVSSAISFIKDGIIIPIVTAIQEIWQQHGQAILTSATIAWQGIQDFFVGVWDFLDAALQTFISLFEGDWDAFGENLSLAWEAAWGVITGFFESLWDTWKPVVESIGSNVVSSLASSIRAGVGAIGEAARSLASSAWDAIKGFFEFGSPSRLMVRAAGWIKQPLISGLADTTAVRASAQQLAVAADPFAGQRGLAGLLINNQQTQRQGLAIGSLAAAGGGGLVVHVDARGSTVTRAEVEVIVERALRKAGFKADKRRRTR